MMNTKGTCAGCGKRIEAVYGLTYCPACSKTMEEHEEN